MTNNFDETSPNRPPEPRQRNGCVTAFLLVVGVILLLPGVLCVIINAKGGPGSGGDPITMFVMLIALGGLGLIVLAVAR
ncbi:MULTISPECIES: hypothetical protein [unclassified Bradyrhizobium]|uniref:hypothetical protein n=1 Tax=unclassified Bradyrhizobium TaxID=2631580 RepID=UPI00041AA36B|nr:MULTISPECIES: hypothetical protein [unclassified Bradyrhizobium]QIG96339.1 hypothetical protein G6P99_30680 [Bradyrhizobium sp. 6(2017)]